MASHSPTTTTRSSSWRVASACRSPAGSARNGVPRPMVGATRSASATSEGAPSPSSRSVAPRGTSATWVSSWSSPSTTTRQRTSLDRSSGSKHQLSSSSRAVPPETTTCTASTSRPAAASRPATAARSELGAAGAPSRAVSTSMAASSSTTTRRHIRERRRISAARATRIEPVPTFTGATPPCGPRWPPRARRGACAERAAAPRASGLSARVGCSGATSRWIGALDGVDAWATMLDVRLCDTSAERCESCWLLGSRNGATMRTSAATRTAAHAIGPVSMGGAPRRTWATTRRPSSRVTTHHATAVATTSASTTAPTPEPIGARRAASSAMGTSRSAPRTNEPSTRPLRARSLLTVRPGARSRAPGPTSARESSRRTLTRDQTVGRSPSSYRSRCCSRCRS